MADFDDVQDAIDKKHQFELWDRLKPQTPPHKVTIYAIPDELYYSLQDELDYFPLGNSSEILKDYAI